ncbi:MAG: hypothetical protein AB7T22_00640 [Calditrichaceae bacterium]
MDKKDYKNIIPHPHVVFGLTGSKSPAEVTLRSAEWAVITQVDGNKSVDDIAQVLALTEEEAIGLFIGLYEKGLIEIQSTEKPLTKLVNHEFFENLEKELMAVIGPVAPFLIEDTLLEMGEDKDKFMVERIPDLIETISDEINDDGKKIKFQSVMLNYIKKGLE